MTTPIAIVTGAPGWLGTRLVEALLNGLPDSPELKHEKDRQVRALTFSGTASVAGTAATAGIAGVAGSKGVTALAKLSDRLKIVPADLKNAPSLESLFEDAGGATVFHCAGVVHPSKSIREFYQVNVDGTRNMLVAARKARVKRFIHISSNSPFGFNSDAGSLFDENSPYAPYMNYGRSKKLAEDLVNEAGQSGQLETVIIRPPWFYGPGQPPRQTLFFTMIRTGKAPIVGSGENLRSMSYVDNICQAMLLAETNERANGQAYWIADEKPYSMVEIIDTIESLLEKDFALEASHKRLRLPDIASQIALVSDQLIQSLGAYHQKVHVLSEMNKNIACSVAKAKSELGYSPKIALREGMKRSIQWVIDQGQLI